MKNKDLSLVPFLSAWPVNCEKNKKERSHDTMAPAAKAKCLDGGSFPRFLGRDKRKKRNPFHAVSSVVAFLCCVPLARDLPHESIRKNKGKHFLRRGRQGEGNSGGGETEKILQCFHINKDKT